VRGEGEKHLFLSPNIKLGSRRGALRVLAILSLKFLFSHVLMSKGGTILARELPFLVVVLASGGLLSGKSLFQLRKNIRNYFPTFSHDFNHFYNFLLFYLSQLNAYF
jgi:hypothetical protein